MIFTNIDNQKITNSVGAHISGGSMNNPMYRNICGNGCYEHLSGRDKRRLIERNNKKEERKLNCFYRASKKKSNLKGFG